MACGGRTSSGKGGVPQGQAGGMTCARVLAGGPRVGKTSCSGVLVRPGTSDGESASCETSTLLLWAHGVGVHADAPAHSFPTNADARGEAMRTMPRALACCPLYCGVQGRHQDHSLGGRQGPAARTTRCPIEDEPVTDTDNNQDNGEILAR